MKWQSQRRFCFVQVDQVYQPWLNRCSMPPCGVYLATSNISPINKVNTKYNGQSSEKEPFATSNRQICQIDKSIHTITSSAESSEDWHGGGNGPSIRSIAQLVIQKVASGGERRETHFVYNEEKEKWTEDDMDRETAVAGMRIEDAEIAIMHKQEDIGSTGLGGLRAREPERTDQEMLNAIQNSLSDLATSGDGEDGEDEDNEEEDSELGKPSEDDGAGWVMSTITKTVQHYMERIHQKQMTLD